MTNITAGATQAITFMTTAFGAITDNVYLAVFLGVTPAPSIVTPRKTAR